MTLTLQKYKDIRIKQIEDLVKTADLINYDITEAVKKGSEEAPELKEYLESLVTWRDVIQDAKDIDRVDQMYEGFFTAKEQENNKKLEEKPEEQISEEKLNQKLE
ncbi:13456_t:CDS:2, partial [Funneliformis geosporum]